MAGGDRTHDRRIMSGAQNVHRVFLRLPHSLIFCNRSTQNSWRLPLPQIGIAKE